MWLDAAGLDALWRDGAVADIGDGKTDDIFDDVDDVVGALEDDTPDDVDEDEEWVGRNGGGDEEAAVDVTEEDGDKCFSSHLE